MYVLELAVQRVRGFAQGGRISLKPGYLVLRSEAPGAVPLGGLVSALCFADGRGGDSGFIAPGQKTGKAGLTFLGNDQVTYRVVRDLGGSGALHRLNKTSGQFEVITQDASEVAQFLRSQVGLPPKTTFEQVFCFSAAQLPTGRPKPAPPGAAAARKTPSLAAPDVASAEARLSELERELELTREVDELQFRQDGLASQTFELESKLRGGDGLRAAVKEAEAAWASAPTPESLRVSRDILARAERYPELLRRRDEALAKLDLERQDSESSYEAPPQLEPVWRDTRFLAGLIAGAAFLVAGSFLEGYSRYVALLDIPAFGLAALLALKYVDDLQGQGRTHRKGSFLAVREKKIRDEFEAEASIVREAISSANVESHTELSEVLSRKPLLAEKLAELQAQLADLERDPDYASAAAQYQQIKAEQEQINQVLLEKGGGLRDLREVEKEIARTREAIEKTKELSAPEPASPAVPTGPAEIFEDPMPPVLLLGADLLTTDVASLGAALRDRGTQYLAALTDRRYHGLELDKNGKAFALAPGGRIPVGELPGKDLDLFYFAVRLTLIERYCARFKVPVLIDDLPNLLEPVKLPLLGRMLKHLGSMTQVLHVSGDRALPEVADGAVSV